MNGRKNGESWEKKKKKKKKKRELEGRKVSSLSEVFLRRKKKTMKGKVVDNKEGGE